VFTVPSFSTIIICVFSATGRCLTPRMLRLSDYAIYF
jgi:hypothetical protein